MCRTLNANRSTYGGNHKDLLTKKKKHTHTHRKDIIYWLTSQRNNNYYCHKTDILKFSCTTSNKKINQIKSVVHKMYCTTPMEVVWKTLRKENNKPQNPLLSFEVWRPWSEQNGIVFTFNTNANNTNISFVLCCVVSFICVCVSERVSLQHISSQSNTE